MGFYCKVNLYRENDKESKSKLVQFTAERLATEKG